MTRLEQKLHLIYGGKNLHIFMLIITPTELCRSDYHSCDNCSAVGPHGSLVSWDGYYYEVNFPGTATTCFFLICICQQAKEEVILRLATSLGCQSEAKAYPTKMDGKSHWQCRVHTGEDEEGNR